MRICNKLSVGFLVLFIVLNVMPDTVRANEMYCDAEIEYIDDGSQAANGKKYRVISKKANVYVKPTASSTIIAVLSKNDLVTVKNIENGWASIIMSGGTGYIRESDIAKYDIYANNN